MAEGPAPGQKIGTARRLIAVAPLILFLALAILFYVRLNSGVDNRIVPSPLVGKPAPQSALPPLEGLNGPAGPIPGFAISALKGKAAVVNVWASWCVPCRQEHPILLRLGKDRRFVIAGINYKDDAANALSFLGQLGNPYDAVGVDGNGEIAIDWGVYGVPETFVIDGNGVIVHKHVGPLTDEAVEQTLLPMLETVLQATQP